jgi:hypothetical protein
MEKKRKVTLISCPPPHGKEKGNLYKCHYLRVVTLHCLQAFPQGCLGRGS